MKNYWNTKLKKKLVWGSPTNTHNDDHVFMNLAQFSSASLIPEIEISNINIQGRYGNTSSACVVDTNSSPAATFMPHAIDSNSEPTTAATQTQFGDHKAISKTSSNISSSISQRLSSCLSTSSTTSWGLELEINNLGSCNWPYGTGSTSTSVSNNEDGIDNLVDYLGFDSSITTHHHHLLLNGFGCGF